MEQSILLFFAAICLYIAAKMTGRVFTLVFWIGTIVTGFGIGYCSNNAFLVCMSVVSILFLLEDWFHFKKPD